MIYKKVYIEITPENFEDVLNKLASWWFLNISNLRKKIKKINKENEDLLDTTLSNLTIELSLENLKVDLTNDQVDKKINWNNFLNDSYYYVFNSERWIPRKKHIFKESAINEAFRLSEIEKKEFEVLKCIGETKMKFDFKNY